MARHRIQSYNAFGLPGCVTLVKQTDGHMRGVYSAHEAGMARDEKNPWAVVCEDHAVVVRTSLYWMATMAKTTDFCWECQNVSLTTTWKSVARIVYEDRQIQQLLKIRQRKTRERTSHDQENDQGRT